MNNLDEFNADTMREHIRAVFRESETLRDYGLDDSAVDALAAYAPARWQGHRGNSDEFTQIADSTSAASRRDRFDGAGVS